MENTIPEITAYRLEEAVAILTKNCIKYSIKKISPSYRTESIVAEKDRGEATIYRVLKQTLQAGNILELTIARETAYIQS
ncbi:MAG: hypothetical protein GX989_02685 [Firmicutes bacterium]|jgi:beta-lactam-binding protein with PASTA domain|nr:hypothetical protein [Bacillota bacterium]